MPDCLTIDIGVEDGKYNLFRKDAFLKLYERTGDELAKYFAMLPACLSGNVLFSAFMFFDLGQKLARRDPY